MRAWLASPPIRSVGLGKPSKAGHVLGRYSMIVVLRRWLSMAIAALCGGSAARRSLGARLTSGIACLSTWLNGGVYPTQVAEWAGHSVDVLLRICAKRVVGQGELAKRRIFGALRED